MSVIQKNFRFFQCKFCCNERIEIQLEVVMNISHIAKAIALASFSIAPSVMAEAIVLDGKLDEPQWQQATAFNTFYKVVPATLEQTKKQVNAKVYSNEKGIYVGIINYQSAETRKKQFNIKDNFMQGEFNRIYLDFGGDGSSGYLFATTLGGGTQDAVLTPQLTTDYDWDGDWQSQYFEHDDYWSTEVFIPWHTVSFHHSADENGQSKVGVSIQLYDIANNFIYASQKQTISNSDFYLAMPKVSAEIPNQQQLAFIPYITQQNDLSDRQGDKGQTDVGFDLIYKPAHHQKLSVSVNPDFGQVDSDDVNINYSAVETLRTDKRPFFTQDISVFNVQAEQNTKLIHTRRIGAGSDDGSENITPIDAAVRFVHQGEQLQLGAFAVEESNLDSDAGKSFYVARAKYRQNNWQTGLLTTHVKRPYLDRSASTLAWDSQYQSATWSLQGALLLSQIDTDAEINSTQTGNGLSLNLGYQFSPNTKISNRYLKLNDQFDNRDMGYLVRNDWQYAQSEFEHSVNYTNDWVTRVKHVVKLSHESNGASQSLPAWQTYSSQFMLTTGAQFNLTFDYLTQGEQDNLGFNTTAFTQPSSQGVRLFYQSPYVGDFSWAASFEYDKEGFDSTSTQYAVDLTWMPHANWSINWNNYLRTGEGWLVANQQNVISEYDRDYFASNIIVNGLITEKLEWSSSIQVAFLDAKTQQVFAVQEQGELLKQELDTSFEDNRLTAQFKLRYRMGPFSDVFLVYRRGSVDSASYDRDSIGQNSYGNRTSTLWTNPIEDSVTFKVRYLF